MKKMEDTIALRLQVQTLIYGFLIGLIGVSHLLITSTILEDSLKPLFLSMSGFLVVLIGVTAYFHSMTISDLRLVESVLKSIDDAVVITNKHNRIVYVNDQFLNTTQSPYEKIVGKDPSYFKSDVHDEAFYVSMWDSINEKGRWHGEIWDKKEDGTLYSKNLLIRPVGKHRGRPRFYIGVFKDLTPYKTLEDRTEYERVHFIPTELPNEIKFKHYMEKMIERKHPFQLFYIRITNYSYLVSAHGADAFYETLKTIRDSVEARFDTVTLGQIDRETLLMIRQERYEEEAFIKWVRSFQETIESPVASFMKFDTKTGVALYPEHGDQPETLLTNATMAFDYTYEKSMNDYAVYDPGFQKMIAEEYAMRDAIIEGIDRQEFYMVYHPIARDVESKRLYAVEALIRWQSEKFGNVSPEVFIPIVEKFYLMNRLSHLVIKEAVKQKSILDQTFGPGIIMSINTSATQYESEILIDTLKDDLNHYRIDPSEIMVEITESSIMENIESTVEYLHRIRELGIQIALDDFGTGFSSLNYLRSMPIQFVKIDRSFVKDYPDKDDGSLARTIIKIGNDLNLDVIAEGIETPEQATMLEKAGCEFFQGYHYSEPLRPSKLKQYIDAHLEK